MAGMHGAGMVFYAGSFIGTIVAEVAEDFGGVWAPTFFEDPQTGIKTAGITFNIANATDTTRGIIIPPGTSHVRVRVSAYTSGSTSCVVRGSEADDNSRFANIDISGRNLGGQGLEVLFIDLNEGGVTNTAIWSSSTLNMTITGLSLGSNATTGSYAILTSRKKFMLSPIAPIRVCFSSLFTAAANAVVDFGIGAPTTTANPTVAAYFKIDSAGVITANVIPSGLSVTTITLGTFGSAPFITGAYYNYIIETLDYGFRFIIQDMNGNKLADAVVTSVSTGGIGVTLLQTTHQSIFCRAFNTGASASVINITSLSILVYGLDVAANKDWAAQMVGTGRGANINPVTFAQTAQLAAGAAPGLTTPTNATCAYATLGGEYALQNTASSENLLGVFGFQVPSPYSFYITDIVLPAPVVTTTLGATVEIIEWCLMVGSTNVPSSSVGFRNTLGIYTAAASAVAGTAFAGQTAVANFRTPIMCFAGQFILILVKVISGSATGVYRGSIFINGYFE
jgi:hypothetical protein